MPQRVSKCLRPCLGSYLSRSSNTHHETPHIFLSSSHGVSPGASSRIDASSGVSTGSYLASNPLHLIATSSYPRIQAKRKIRCGSSPAASTQSRPARRGCWERRMTLQLVTAATNRVWLPQWTISRRHGFGPSTPIHSFEAFRPFPLPLITSQTPSWNFLSNTLLSSLVFSSAPSSSHEAAGSPFRAACHNAFCPGQAQG